MCCMGVNVRMTSSTDILGTSQLHELEIIMTSIIVLSKLVSKCSSIYLCMHKIANIMTVLLEYIDLFHYA